MRILLIKLKHIGDNLILTPTICALKKAYPKCHITVLVRQGGQGILERCPEIDERLTTTPPEKKNRCWNQELTHTLQLIKKLRTHKYDHIFELTNGDRGRWLASLSKATSRWACAGTQTSALWKIFFKKLITPKSQLHSVEKDYQLISHALELETEPPPLRFQPTKEDLASIENRHAQNSIIIHPVTRWKRKQWPETYWKELLTTLINQGEKIILSSGPEASEREFCHKLQQHAGTNCQFTGGLLPWNQLGAILQTAKLFIGVDTAVMHLAAACQTPTIAIFLPWNIQNWHPWKNLHITPCPEGYTTEPQPYATLQQSQEALQAITPKHVLEAIHPLLGVSPNC